MRSLAAAAVALIAALVGCSSGGDATPGRDATPPSSVSTETEFDVHVRTTDVQIELRLDGTTEASDAVGLAADQRLELRPTVPDGTVVAAGDIVGEWSIPNDLAEVLQRGAASSRNVDHLSSLLEMVGPVRAPTAGILTLDEPMPRIRTPGIDVVAVLTPLQHLRLLSTSFTGRAQVETTMGPKAIACESLWVGPTIDGPFGSGPGLHCRLPSWVETAPGLKATLKVTSSVIENATVVPNLYIAYDPDLDSHYVIADGVTTPVTLGITDGVIRVITSDIRVGAKLTLPEAQP